MKMRESCFSHAIMMTTYKNLSSLAIIIDELLHIFAPHYIFVYNIISHLSVPSVDDNNYRHAKDLIGSVYNICSEGWSTSTYGIVIFILMVRRYVLHLTLFGQKFQPYFYDM